MIKKSFAKTNLGLKIINQRTDGYHNLQSIFIQISLYDKLKFIPHNKFQIKSTGISVPLDKSNTIFKAVNLIENKFNIKIKYRVELEKNIPLGSGLGGGSSNAAITLLTLLDLYNIKLDRKKLINLAKQIGCDVPFFIHGGIKMVDGVGDKISNIDSSVLVDKKILLVFPEFQISTKWAYSQVKKHLDTIDNHPKFSPLTENVNWKLFENDFEKVVFTTYPEILKIKEILYNEGALYSGLSGSGSTMFGIYNDMITAKKAVKSLNKYHTHIASPVI